MHPKSGGRAGGKIKTGYHVPGNGATVTRIGYTALRAMGIEERQWGTQSNTTSEVISEIWA